MIMFLVCNTHEIYHDSAKKSELGLYRIRTFQLKHEEVLPSVSLDYFLLAAVS